jgi:predicted short-subunit dehydrogenase-like oxidoreductase (DUF2520 family)
LVGAGHRIVSVAGRTPDAESTQVAAARFDARAVPVQFTGRGAELVVIATPDDAIEATARAVAQSLEAGALVVHLAGAYGLDALAPVSTHRSDVRVGALHPLQTLPSPDAPLAGAWAAVAGPPEVTELAEQAGMQAFTVDDDARAVYHAAAVVASNHLVGLMGQVARLADAANVPFAAFEPLVRVSIDNAFALGPADAITGPVARGDVATVTRHLHAIPHDEVRTYRALAEAVLRLSGRDDAAMRGVLA